MPTIPEALAQAVAYHNAGQLPMAERVYRQILQADPEHPDAWHLLGVLAHQAGRNDVAVEYLSRAIALAPALAAYHSNLGEVYRALRKPAEAVACYRRALALEPG